MKFIKLSQRELESSQKQIVEDTIETIENVLEETENKIYDTLPAEQAEQVFSFLENKLSKMGLMVQFQRKAQTPDFDREVYKIKSALKGLNTPKAKLLTEILNVLSTASVSKLSLLLEKITKWLNVKEEEPVNE